MPATAPPATQPDATPAGRATPAPAGGPPLRPRRALAYGLLAAFLIWLAALWAIYFATVHNQPTERPQGPAGPGVTVPR